MVFTCHIEKVFHAKTVGVHILVDLGKLRLPFDWFLLGSHKRG